MAQPNTVRTAHNALAALLERVFPEATLVRNPGGKEPPAPRGVEGVAVYIALEDDSAPEVLNTMCGPIYDLRLEPMVTIALSGGTRDERQAQAYALLDTLSAAIRADISLGAGCDYAETMTAQPVEASDSSWMAGGLDVGVEILLTAPTRAG
jgi:hypothetical protein